MGRKNLVLILGDQLSTNISSLQMADRNSDRVLIAEVQTEATYVNHHKKKIAFLFSAMRHFAEELRSSGWSVDYIKIDNPENSGSLFGEVKRSITRRGLDGLIVTEPGEWRLFQEMAAWQTDLDLPVRIPRDSRFLCSREEFANWADGRKQLRMEYFYREMRRKTGLLMVGEAPVGGRWNFDADNRKAASSDTDFSTPLKFEPDAVTRDVISTVNNRFADHFGDLDPFWFAVTADQAGMAFEHFLDNSLASFGDYQDAMLSGERFLSHSVISQYLNAGLLDPMSLCRKVEREYIEGRVPLNSAEGFIRQVIGWREFVRGIYWLNMPDYVELNYLDADRDLPEFYWSSKTDMNCVREAILQTKEEAYAHHIQRLMVTGNFALLAGIEPRQVHEWYLSVYADAYEWVELPNTIGMSQFADGGLLASKPYAASGNYISKMSNYCDTCRYEVKKKFGENACPFNPLYWDFLSRNESKLRANP
ncbi:MAG: cryptochrome/photolyase family protein, partial [Pseudomonadota bacterium]